MDKHPLWRREELWRSRDPSHREKAAMMEDFAYELEAPYDDDSFTIRAIENHDEIGNRVWDGCMYLGKMIERAHRLGQGRCELPLVARSDTPAASSAVFDLSLPSLKDSGAGGVDTPMMGKNRFILELGAGTGVLACVLSHLANSTAGLKPFEAVEAVANTTASAACTAVNATDSALTVMPTASSSSMSSSSTRNALTPLSPSSPASLLRIIPTDTRVVVDTMQINIDRNGVSGSVIPRVLQWGDDAQAESLLEFIQEDQGGHLTYLVASDLAASIVVVPHFVKTARILLERGRGCHASGDVRPVDCKRRCCRSSASSSSSSSSSSSRPGHAPVSPAAASPWPAALSCHGHPALLLCQHMHREFTAPLLDALSAEAYLRIQQVSPDAAHPDFISPRHQAFWVTYQCPLSK